MKGGAPTRTRGPRHLARPEVLAAFAGLKTSVGLAIVRAKAWSAWAEDQDVSYDEVRASALHAVRELGLALNDSQVARELDAVANAWRGSLQSGSSAGGLFL